ncbi:hypothetical protein QTO34_000835 [Cnephaeus nilssonii]|uniref:Exportin-7/Ran-binding protein 17 TPR repeats domain-containing protein n=1 Tax=Cnephaeus nilssonii TaxID=3371016 RepID=A0AA40ICD3_CNENI|nr:hypothetical protein QTO34_000835 [Eptesicus nilssonii]
MQLLKLTHNCLHSDFIRASTDESPQMTCAQSPTFEDPCLTMQRGRSSSLILLMVLNEYWKIHRVYQTRNNYHEFCRRLAQLKTNYQTRPGLVFCGRATLKGPKSRMWLASRSLLTTELGELVKVENYPEAIRVIANFTVTSLQHWEFARNSVHCLLSLRQWLAASVPYVKTTEPHMLETYTPEVTKGCLESVHIILRDALEEPLENTSLVQQQLNQLSTIGHCEYKTHAQSYQELLQSASASPMGIAVQEQRLTLLVFTGAVIGGQVSFDTTDEQDAMHGELVYWLMTLTDSHLAQVGKEKLELAMLRFFEQFCKIYIGNQI